MLPIPPVVLSRTTSQPHAHSQEHGNHSSSARARGFCTGLSLPPARLLVLYWREMPKYPVGDGGAFTEERRFSMMRSSSRQHVKFQMLLVVPAVTQTRAFSPGHAASSLPT